MGFRRNYLPSQSQPWTREVQSRVEAMERDVVLSDINNRTRDDQLQSSYNRLDSAFVTLATQQTTLESQQTELTTVSAEADTALQTAITANGLAISAGNAASDANAEALDALQKIIDLGSPGGPTINASNLSAGTITGVTIQGNVITGGSISGTSISGGSITSVSSLEVPFGPVFGQTVSASSNISSQGGLQRDQLAGGGTTGASITSGGYFVRTSSSARYKTDIEDAEFSLESVLQLQPKTFRLKEEVEEEPENALVYPGFIAEDIAGTDLDVFVNYENLPDGTKRPDGVRYAELTAALVSAMKQQNQTIKTLEARLDALEAK
jgi:hypothetical protein